MLNETHIHSRRISGVEDLSDIQSIKLYEDWDANFNRILRVIKYDNKQFAHMSNLIDIIEKPFTGERLYAMRELRTMGAAAKSAVSVLIKASTENNAEIKKSSIETLGQIGPDAADAAPALAAALNDPDKDVRLSATMALGKIGPNAAEAVPAIIAALKDPDKEIRLSAAVALGEIGPAAVEAVPALVAALKSPRALIPRFAAIALRKIGPPLQKS